METRLSARRRERRGGGAIFSGGRLAFCMQNRVPIFDRPVSGRETLSQLVFVLALLHFVQHLDGSPPGLGQPVQTHSCSPLQPQRWPTSAPVMSTPGSDDLPGSPALPAPEAAAEDTRAQALSHRSVSRKSKGGKTAFRLTGRPAQCDMRTR